jgi:hypothetical protein
MDVDKHLSIQTHPKIYLRMCVDDKTTKPRFKVDKTNLMLPAGAAGGGGGGTHHPLDQMPDIAVSEKHHLAANTLSHR